MEIPIPISLLFCQTHYEKGFWWNREKVGLWLPTLSRDNKELKDFWSKQGGFSDCHILS